MPGTPESPVMRVCWLKELVAQFEAALIHGVRSLL